jgi:hypothetical protein
MEILVVVGTIATILQTVVYLVVTFRAERRVMANAIPRTEAQNPSRRLLLFMAGLTLLSWVALGINYYTQFSSESVFPNPDTEYLEGYGPTPLYHDGVEVRAKGRLLIGFAKTYSVGTAVLHHHGIVDILDDIITMKSTLYDITKNEIVMRIPYSDKFKEEVNSGKIHTAYHLLLIPRGITFSQFDTLRQGVALGVIIVETRGGPP